MPLKYVVVINIMAKSREKIQQIGFWDAEVSNASHDQVCLWAYENADLIVRTAFPTMFDREWLDNEIHRVRHYNNDQSTIDMKNAFRAANPRPNPRIFNKTLEYVLKSYTGYQNKLERIVGYADLLIQFQLPTICPKYKPAAKVGEDDEFDGYELGWSNETPREINYPIIIVEAKSVLPTVGELMRQIQLYRTALNCAYVVVSPDESYTKILAEQGVTFIKYSPS